MALNPIVYTEKVVRNFLRYQLTAYPFTDERLLGQMRGLLSLDETRRSPLLQGPYVSLSRPFRQGAAVEELVAEGVLHPHMRQRIPAAITHVYGHQGEAIRSIRAGRTTLVSTGTGSGKSECFLYPVISRCLELRDEGAAPGISAVIVYPMNALAEDQLQRIRGLLAGTGIPFGMYVGKTPEGEADVTGVRLGAGASQADYEAVLERVRRESRDETVHPPEEVCSREAMRTPGRQPRILLTNVKQLELLLTRQRDVELFSGARLDFLVFDEAHTFSGALGAETACLIRRLRSFCGRGARDTVCVATSATIVDREHPDAAQDFAARFFGVPKDSVATVGEAYEREVWTPQHPIPAPPGRDPGVLLQELVEAVDDVKAGAVRGIFRELARLELPVQEWTEALYSALSGQQLVFRLSELLASPQRLDELARQLSEEAGRDVAEAEVLAWLTLGAAARREGRPLLRPVVHLFLRGIGGSVVSFPEEEPGPQLWLTAEDELSSAQEGRQHAHFPVTTCTTCGQHYYIAFLEDFEYVGRQPGGGEAVGETGFWQPLEESHGGRRVILADRILGSENDDALDEHERTAALHFCRSCGAAHREAGERCLHCGAGGGRVVLHAIRQKADNPGFLTSCLSCGSTGRRLGSRYREPARPVRATHVADVHVLAQDMVHHAERPRLLVFCDNRQDAAFQAGWMKDHARRFRMRALMAQGLEQGALSVGDLALTMDEALEKDEALSRALIPEVWQVKPKEGSGGKHQQERQKFLRFQVLREVTLSSRQSIGLEPWGRMKIEYEGLDASWPWIQRWSRRLGLPAEELREGVASLLDALRRTRVLHDPWHGIFGKYWMDGDPEIQQGCLPQLGGPRGTKLRRGDGEKNELVTQWISDRGDTTFRQLARKWTVPTDEIVSFLEELFEQLKERRLLVPVTLKGSKGRNLPSVSGLYQVDADRLRLHANHGVWRCKQCSRRTTRRTPAQLCPAWRCDGGLEFVRENEDDYDLQLLDQGYTMLRPEEHTAMVPRAERERLENLFKGESEAVNVFVCTPTLELGVDIGQLDSVLMRNVPPLPANYWQRAGRAGRRHRMAVNLTYCRPVSHDRAYFHEPLKLLAGRVDPPAFNLRNELMVAKHVHATVITRLHQLGREPGRPEAERAEIQRTLHHCLPPQVSAYLFEDGLVRGEPFDCSPLRDLIDRHGNDLVAFVEQAFTQGWPAADAEVVTPAVLREHIDQMVPRLEAVVARLAGRLHWTMAQIARLSRSREQRGDLDPDDDALFRRCDRLIKRLKGTAKRQRREAEGYDDTNTMGVLAAQGFLPGYGLEVGSILGTAEIPFWRTGALDFTLPRPPSTALREYVPGNLIYANGHRFVARRFHRDVDQDRIETPAFEISVERQAVRPTTLKATPSSLDSAVLQTIAVCDVDLVHQSHISDEEDLRFQLPVAVFGLERGPHGGGRAWSWGAQTVLHRRGVRLRLVNVGASSAIADSSREDRFGYPLCTTCGQSVSPLSSLEQRQKFSEGHQERCRREPTPVGFYADVTADVLSLPACRDQGTAYSILETLRFAAASVLDMQSDDLQVLVIGHVYRDEVDGLLWDPMPGGSGLLDQVVQRFGEVLAAARDLVEKCPGACETSCIDCLQTFRNGYYHKHLDRRRALECLEAWGRELALSHEIPPRHPDSAAPEVGRSANDGERRLRELLVAAGFEAGIREEQLHLDRAIGTTTPDVIYRAPHQAPEEGVAIYLDGLSGHLHGNPTTREQDQRIRSWLRNQGWEVIEISCVELDDRQAMRRHFRKLATYLERRDLREALEHDGGWFERAKSRPEPTSGSAKAPRRVDPRPQDRYRTCVPLVTLQAAAGGFGETHLPEGSDTEWVQVEGVRKLCKGMFVAQVVGRSMEPRIPNGSYCLFAPAAAGSREPRIVLAALRDDQDPETGERYTIKRYRSEKVHSEDGTWRHFRIMLEPLNPSCEALHLDCEDEGRVRIVADFIQVLDE